MASDRLRILPVLAPGLVALMSLATAGALPASGAGFYVPPAVPGAICAQETNSHACAIRIESYLGVHESDGWTRRDGRLLVFTQSGPPVVLEDAVDAIPTYQYFGRLSETLALVHAQYYESSRYVLIDLVSGERAGLEGPPVAADGGSLFASVATIGHLGPWATLEVVERRDAGFHSAARVRLYVGEAPTTRLSWVANREVELRTESAETSRVFSLSVADGKWTLSEKPPEGETR